MSQSKAIIRKILVLEKQAKEDKRKVLSENEALAKYKHLLK